ncbi:MAG: type II toxin-antitoxin system VapC family toxin [Lentisphaeria bacterium]|nr:type II toxin-antitoxin system VapC family toxin [Lentisphaeria bacterium]
MKKSIYIETSIASYLTSRPSRDVRAAAWQQLTSQWWDEARHEYELFVSELVIVEASAGDPEAASRRLAALEGIPELPIDGESQALADRFIAEGGIPPAAEADALHVAVAAVHGIDYLMTWNCRHIDNARAKPLLRSICAIAGYVCPEICTPMELLPEDMTDV